MKKIQVIVVFLFIIFVATSFSTVSADNNTNNGYLVVVLLTPGNIFPTIVPCSVQAFGLVEDPENVMGKLYEIKENGTYKAIYGENEGGIPDFYLPMDSAFNDRNLGNAAKLDKLEPNKKYMVLVKYRGEVVYWWDFTTTK